MYLLIEIPKIQTFKCHCTGGSVELANRSSMQCLAAARADMPITYHVYMILHEIDVSLDTCNVNQKEKKREKERKKEPAARFMQTRLNILVIPNENRSRVV